MKHLVLTLLILLTFSYANASRADDACGGTLIDYKPVQINGENVGQLHLYYNSTSGNNCAIFYHAGPTWGKPLITSVELYVCKPNRDNCGVWQRDPWWKRDDGKYSYHAGPVRIDGRDRCVKSVGYIEYKGKTGVAVSAVHCR